MERKIYLIGVVSAVLSGMVLLALGVLIGHSWSSPTPTTLEVGLDADGVMRLDNTVTVKGQGLVRVEPEIAQTSLGVEICAQDASDVNQQVNASLISVMENLQMAGIAQDDIVPSDFSLYPRYERQTLVGFCAENKLLVTTEDLDNVSNVVDQAIEAGATNVYSVKFTVRDTSAARQEAIRLAFADVRQQVEQLSATLGQTIEQVVKVDMSVRDYMLPYVAGYSGGGGMIAPQEGALEATVTLVYELPGK
jgi:uncharacterized protein YggE